MNERYMTWWVPDETPSETEADTLVEIWTSVIYGPTEMHPTGG